MTWSAGTVIGGKYQLERRIGAGAMGAVWIARHLQLGTQVAVKRMDAMLVTAAEARARFEREARSTAQLQSPHVVRVHDYGVEDVPYLVMELLSGEDLETRLRREGRMSLSAANALLGQICKGVRSAHNAGVIHRDLKPANVFLARVDGEELVKILDFGVAKVEGLEGEGSTTRSGSLVGTPLYMSPEQARSAPGIDHRTDLWSIGVILFRCLTGEMPFAGQSVGDVILSICADPIPRPSRHQPALSTDVDAFFARALAREVGKRFQSAGEMAEAFAALAADAAPATVPLPPPMVAASTPSGGATMVLDGAPPERAPFAAPRRDEAVATDAGVAAPGISAAGAPGPPRARSLALPAVVVAVVMALFAGGLVLVQRSRPQAAVPAEVPSVAAAAPPSTEPAAPSEAPPDPVIVTPALPASSASVAAPPAAAPGPSSPRPAPPRARPGTTAHAPSAAPTATSRSMFGF